MSNDDFRVPDLVASCPRDSNGYARTTAGALAGRGEVISGVELQHVWVSKGEIRANFVASRFEGCVFEGIRARERFWGARDEWLECSFRGARLEGMISPQNKFEDCSFADVVIRGYRCHATEFRNCRFQGLDLEAFRASGSTTFSGCVFEQPRFSGCRFGGTRFIECSFSDPFVEDCDFSDVQAAPGTWWEAGQSKNPPFQGFLRELALVSEKTLGAGHSLTENVRTFQAEFVAGRRSSEEFEEDVIGSANAADLRKIDKDLFRLYKRFAL